MYSQLLHLTPKKYSYRTYRVIDDLSLMAALKHIICEHPLNVDVVTKLKICRIPNVDSLTKNLMYLVSIY